MSVGKFSYDKEARNILRYGAFIAAVSLMVYALMIQIGVITKPTTIVDSSPEINLAIVIAWLALGTMSFLINPKNKFLSVSEIALYYSLAIIHTLFITSIVSPFTAYWVLLFISTYVLFGKHGLQIGVLAFIATLIVDTFASIDNPEHLLMAVFTTISTLASGLVIVTIYASQQTSHLELINSRNRENAEHDRISTLINNIVNPVFSMNDQGIVQIYNAAALNLLDTNDQLEGKHINELLHLETIDHKPIDVISELSLSTAIRLRDDIIMPLDEEDYIRLEATFAPVQGGGSVKPDGYVLILRDITKAKSLEEERDEFISVVSHELRTPITIAEGSLSNAKLLFERDMPDDKIEAAIDESHKQVLFLARMVNDLSTLSRAERGVADTPEDIDVTELVAQLQNEYTPQAQEKNLAFNINVIGKPGKVHASRLYLEELLQNLITNAIKYTIEGSVTLSVKRDNEKICFEVTDTGIGIGKSDQKKIFDRFYRTEDYRTRQTSGTGLGLYVSAKLAKKLGCKVNVTSRINHGSTFEFSIPIKPAIEE